MKRQKAGVMDSLFVWRIWAMCWVFVRKMMDHVSMPSVEESHAGSGRCARVAMVERRKKPTVCMKCKG